MNRFKTTARRRGFTLAEVVIAFLVLFAGMTAAGLFLTHVLRTSSLTSNITVATGLAEQRLETLMAERRSLLANGSDSPDDFDRQWTVTNDGTTQTIRVWVRWMDVAGRTNEVALREMRAY